MPKIVFALLAAVLLQAPSAKAAEDLNSVLAKLNAAAQNFKSTSADSTVDLLMTVPVPDEQVQKGQVYFERTGKSVRLAGHILTVNGEPVPKTYVFANGQLKVWEGGNLNQVTTITKAAGFEGYLALGFGASGTDLQEKWNITYDGQETVNGVQTARLELVAKDPGVRKNLPKVTVWMDTTRGVSLKQVFDEGQGQTRTCTYTNIKVNQPLPSDAFTFKTDKKTHYINR